mgnify:CR=1 FL=1
MNIKDALDYLDEKKLKYENMNKLTANFIVNEKKHDLENTTFEMHVDGKIYATGTCNLIGFFSYEYGIWQWAWSMTTDSQTTKHQIMRKLLMMIIDFEIQNSVMNITRTAMLTSKLYIKHPQLELEIYLALIMYLTKAEWYLPVEVSEKTTKGLYYYTLQTINIL